MDEYDIKIIREEGEDTRKVLELLRKDIKETNRLLNSIETLLMRIDINTGNVSPYK